MGLRVIFELDDGETALRLVGPNELDEYRIQAMAGFDGPSDLVLAPDELVALRVALGAEIDRRASVLAKSGGDDA